MRHPPFGALHLLQLDLRLVKQLEPASVDGNSFSLPNAGGGDNAGGGVLAVGDQVTMSFSTIDGNTSMDDQRGHGTFVAGIAAGAASGLAGAAPTAPLVSIKVMDSTGTAKTSDIINACQWILDHQAQYNLKVANFSLHSSITAPFFSR